MKIGDLIKWKSNGRLGIIMEIKKCSLSYHTIRVSMADNDDPDYEYWFAENEVEVA